MPEDNENSGEVTVKIPFKVPHKLVLYVLTVLAGSGSIWTWMGQSGILDKADQTSKVTYEVLSEKLNDTFTRVRVCEVRIENLESNLRDLRRTSRAPASAPMATLHGAEPESPPKPDPVVDAAKSILPPAAQESPLPSYERMKAMVQERRDAKSK